MEPITFEPILKRIRWGGQKLGTILGKDIGSETDYAESWEIADHTAGQSLVSDGPYHGRSLSQLLQQHGADIFGDTPVPERFPLLIKYLDANDWLSLQVHPNDAQALTYDPSERGKTEAWVIIDAEPGSRICSGLKSGIRRLDLQNALRRGTIEDCLHFVPVSAGDCVFVPAGTVHAIGPGILLAEVQQQSNLTFRMHDWGRTGADGKPRPLHLEEALDCTDFERGPVSPVASQPRDTESREVVVDCNYFHIIRHTTTAEIALPTRGQMRVLMLLQGAAMLQSPGSTRRLEQGATVLIPATCARVRITPDRPVILLEIGAGPVE